MSDLYEFTVEWPSTTAQTVIVTGDFDQWSKSLPLTRSSTNNFLTATIKVPYGCPTRYKFIIDGEWAIKPDQPTETTSEGYVNNICYVPLKAPSPVANGKVVNGNPIVAQPLGISDFKDTIIASTGTSSALGYVASGFGGVVHSVVGVDPFNANQIAIPTPISPTASMGLPSPTSNILNSESAPMNDTSGIDLAAPDSTQVTGSPVAPIVPITIVPVYAKENCTIDPTKVTSQEESIGTFVGVRLPAKDKTAQEVKGEQSLSPPVESSVLVTTETLKEEKPLAEASAVPKDIAAVAAKPVAEKISATIPDKKTEESSPSVTAAPGEETAANGHAQAIVPVPGSAEVASPRPTTPKSAPAPTESVTSTPASTVRKSKVFPRVGNGSSKSSKAGSTDEFGIKDEQGTTSSRKKRRSSFFGTLKKIFHHEKDNK